MLYTFQKEAYMDIILTGTSVDDLLKEKSDYVYKISKEKVPN